MKESIVQFIQEHKDVLIERWLKEIKVYREEQRLQHLSNDLYDATNRKFVDVMIQSITWSEHNRTEQIQKFAKEQIKLGWPLQYVTKGLQLFKKVLTSEFEKVYEGKGNELDLYHEVQPWADFLVDEVVSEYTGSWQKSDELQRLALKELTAPLIPVFSGISVMPLVGTIDTDRAKLIMENLLQGVIKWESQVVLIDITGVPIVDTMVAHHLIQSSDAVRLVGGQTILVGIRPEIAQTIVNLGIELGQFETTSTLQKGIELALEKTGRKIVAAEVGGTA
ncbi:STAS domain-containing protein [Caldalkalibacillus salinus]|uniref:STAS domain-containing protein n=1 Tax=Caldalkalibacillus salinus TaxID=2803787 RepID=UPI0019204361|nr:STAS domain-containing protein [Caldalkalibacillus salinus]